MKHYGHRGPVVTVTDIRECIKRKDTFSLFLFIRTGNRGTDLEQTKGNVLPKLNDANRLKLVFQLLIPEVFPASQCRGKLTVLIESIPLWGDCIPLFPLRPSHAPVPVYFNGVLRCTQKQARTRLSVLILLFVWMHLPVHVSEFFLSLCDLSAFLS